jgi:hypothetical protein
MPCALSNYIRELLKTLIGQGSNVCGEAQTEIKREVI